MDDELAAEVTAAVGRSAADQVSSELTDLADVLTLYVARLSNEGPFSKPEAREMAREWYSWWLWSDTQQPECDCDE